MVSFRLLRWKETYTIAATPFRETLLVNNLNYPPPAQSPFTKENHGRSFRLRWVVVPAGYRVGKGSNLFPPACWFAGEFPPVLSFVPFMERRSFLPPWTALLGWCLLFVQQSSFIQAQPKYNIYRLSKHGGICKYSVNFL